MAWPYRIANTSLFMDFELSEEQLRLQKGAIEFARSELNDDVVARDRCESFWREGWRKCARFGVSACQFRWNMAASEWTSRQ